MTHISKKIVALAVSSALVCSAIAGCGSETSSSQEKNTKSEENINSGLKTSSSEGFGYKDETVYVTTDEAGKVTDITVSEWLKNREGVGKLKDATNLTDIVNVKGDEKFSEKDGTILFDTTGNDIYYQGRADIKQQLPVNINITYRLDGKEINASEIKGKTGHLEMNISYDATLTKKVMINGEEKEIYVPFLAATGILFDSGKVKNIEVDNGAVLSNGNYEIVAGFSIAGIKETLKNISAKAGAGDIDQYIKNTIKIEADVENYDVAMMMTFVSNSPVQSIDLKDLENADSISGLVARLENAMSQLKGGSTALREGIEKLMSGSDSLTDGIDKLNSGSDTLLSGAGKLRNGIYEVSGGLSKARQGSEKLSESVMQLKNGAAALDNGIDQTISKLTGLVSEVNKQLDTYNRQLETVSSQYNQYVAPSLASQTTGSVTLNAQQLQIMGAYYKLQGVVESLTNIKNNLDSADMSSLSKLSGGSDQLIAGVEKLYNEGTEQLSQALSQLDEGAKQLCTGADNLNNGAGQLAAGIDSLAEKTPELVSGIKALYDGAKQLEEGIDSFDVQAVGKISDIFNNDVDLMYQYVKALVDSSKEYSTFTKMDQSQSGQVKFVIKTY